MTAVVAVTAPRGLVRRPFGPRREVRRPNVALSIAPNDYIPTGTADMWRSARRTFSR